MAGVALIEHAAASVASMAEHLTGPLQAGAQETLVQIDATGAAAVSWATREPLLLASPAIDLDTTALEVTVSVGGGTPIRLSFDPFTERGAQLAVWRPATGGGGLAAPFAMTVTADRRALDGTLTAVPAAGVAAVVELRLLEGVLGRVMYVLAAEKARLRRQAREVSAMRTLALARDDALDRIGAEVGVPRFLDTLAFERGEVVTKPGREGDHDYARRLRLYRPWRIPGRRRALDLLNGTGAGPANTGPLGELGVTDRFTLVEQDDPIAVAIRIVGADDLRHRTRFLEYIRNVHLVWPDPSSQSRLIHERRMRTTERTKHDTALRAAVRRFYELPTGGADRPALAPMLAAALVRVGTVRKALGEKQRWKLERLQDDAGSRYELGLGADLELPTTAELGRLVAARAAWTPSGDAEVDALLIGLTPKPAAADREGRWLLEACGLRTVHRVDSNTLYVSHLPVGGLAVTGPSNLNPSGYASVIALDRGAQPAVLLYEPASGTGEVRAAGDLSVTATNPGWRSTWTQIASGNFGAQPAPGLAFYERATGQVELYTISAQGAISLLRTSTGLGTGWTNVLAGKFTGESRSGLLFYDRSRGVLEIHTTGTNGQLTRLARHDVGGHWTHLAASQFAKVSRTGLFAYSALTGTASIFSFDARGGLKVVRRHSGLPRSWTHVGASGFRSQRSHVVAYDRAQGRLEAYAIDNNGGLELLGRQSTRPNAYTHLTVIDVDKAQPMIALYDRLTGRLETFDLVAGSLNTRRGLRTTRKSSGQLYEAWLHAPGDPGSHATLVTGLAAADAAWQAAPRNGPAWTVLTDAQADAAWTAAAVPGPTVLDVFRAAGLPAVTDAQRAVTGLRRLASELVETIRLAPAQSAAILAAQTGAADELQDLAAELELAGIASALPLASGGSVIIVLGAVQLPEAGVNLAERRSGFRWYVVPIQGLGGTIGATGSKIAFTPAGPGVSALVALAYARGAGTDPYEFRVDLPPNGRLTLGQYEFLMNLLEQSHAAGVEVNTHRIRKLHVDLDGDGVAEPLGPALARTYRQFHRPRLRGEPPQPPEPEEP